MARTGMKAFIQVAILAVFVRVILLVYGAWQDKYLEVKYTDVDYWVVADAANALMVGKSPYIRSTYRYTPVLAAMLVPNSVFGEWWGKSLFAACDLLVGYLIYLFLVRTTNPSRAARLVAVFWLFNPAVFTVSTRGNCESVLCTFILGGLYFLTSNRIALAGVFYGLAVHFKLFPVIYGVAILSYLVCGEKSRKVIESPPMSPIMKSSVASPISSTESSPSVKERKKQKAVKPIEELVSQHAPISTPQKVTHLSPENSTGRIKNILIFGLSSLLSFGLLTGICYYLYGEQYIQEAFTYHLTRRDHRHNFSPYFYLFYTDSVMKLPKFFEFLVFIPQILIFIFAGIKFGRRDLAFACFIITFVFVTFNKVVTAQVDPLLIFALIL
jgi:phosphatidylinositol glycan class M